MSSTRHPGKLGEVMGYPDVEAWYGKDLGDYRRKAYKAAKDLYYGQETLDAIEKAKTEGAIERIMIAARERRFRD